MITLYCGGAVFDLPEASPFVTKTEVHLKMAGLDYRKERGFPSNGPKGQIPYIDDDGAVIGDSTFIRAHIERKYRHDFDAGLTERERAEAWAIERMLENHLVGAMVYARWLQPENFAKGPAHFFDGAPETERQKIREDAVARVTEALRAQGMGRHAPGEIVELGTKSLSALSVLLGDRPYLMGNTACGTDATAFAVIAGILTPFFECEIRKRAFGFSNLVAYADRMMRIYYPEHAWAAA